ncbi:MAG: hypothetical protein RIC03_08970 [Cyclobacteriaceae bacterium]
MNLDKFNNQFDRFILPGFIVLLTFFALTSFYNLTLQLDDLIKIEGEVYDIRIVKERTVKGRIRDNFYVFLNTGERFKIMDDGLFERYRQNIMNQVNRGNRVTIYKRTDIQTAFGLGTSNLIYQLDYNGETLMPLSVMKTNFRTLCIVFTAILAILITGQVIKSRKKATDNRR